MDREAAARRLADLDPPSAAWSRVRDLALLLVEPGDPRAALPMPGGRNEAGTIEAALLAAWTRARQPGRWT